MTIKIKTKLKHSSSCIFSLVLSQAIHALFINVSFLMFPNLLNVFVCGMLGNSTYIMRPFQQFVLQGWFQVSTLVPLG